MSPLVVWHVQDAQERALAGAVVRGVGSALGEWAATTNLCGDATTTLGADHYDVTVSHPSAATRHLPATIQDSGVVTVGLDPLTQSFLPEDGPIHVEGPTFRDKYGAIWSWRGATAFPLPMRFFRGEDIQPTLTWLRAIGVNVARCFVAGWLDTEKPYLEWWYQAQLDAFFALAQANGLRIEATVVTGPRPLDEWRRALAAVYEVASGRWNVFVEDVNEPWVDPVGRDPLAISAGIARHGVLSAYGFQPDATPDHWVIPPVLDYGTMHTQRDVHFPTSSKDLQEVRLVSPIPWVDDEPIGIADFDKPAPGARTADKIGIWSHVGIQRLYTAGGTIHYQSGLDGVPPRDNEPITQEIIQGISALWDFIPPEAQLGTYVRAGLGDFGLRFDPGDSLVNHAYGSIVGDTQYVVVPRPGRESFEDRAVNGWQVDAVGPMPFVLRLKKR